MDVLRPPAASGAAAARGQPAAPAAAPAPPAAPPQFPQHPGFQGWMGGMQPQQQGFPGWFGGGMQQPGGFPGWPPAEGMPGNVEPQAGAQATGATPGFMPPTPQMQFPPFMMMPPSPPVMFPYGCMPPMPAAPSLGGLSLDELRRMEGTERANVEARVQCLRDIQVLLTAALTQMQQYTTVAGTGGSGSGGGGLGGNVNFSSSTGYNEFNLKTGVASPTLVSPSPAVSLASSDVAGALEKGQSSDTTEVLEGAVGGVEAVHVDGAVGGQGAAAAPPAVVDDDETASSFRHRRGVEPS